MEIQMHPAKGVLIMTDKVSTELFESSKEEDLLGILEDKRKDLFSIIKVDYGEFDSLTVFDKLVLFICLAEQFIGNEYTTGRNIHRAMGGSQKNFTETEKKRIMHAVEKLSRIRIDIDTTRAGEVYKGKKIKYVGYLMPVETVTVEINGYLVDGAIHFLRSNPLFELAELKGQYQFQDSRLLDIPRLRLTDTTITLRGYLFERICKIKGSHAQKNKRVTKLRPCILLDTLLKDCAFTDVTKRQLQQMRESITKILDYWKEEKFIQDWHFEKKNNKFHSIVFSFKKSNRF